MKRSIGFDEFSYAKWVTMICSRWEMNAKKYARPWPVLKMVSFDSHFEVLDGIFQRNCQSLLGFCGRDLS